MTDIEAVRRKNTSRSGIRSANTISATKPDSCDHYLLIRISPIAIFGFVPNSSYTARQSYCSLLLVLLGQDSKHSTERLLRHLSVDVGTEIFTMTLGSFFTSCLATVQK